MKKYNIDIEDVIKIVKEAGEIAMNFYNKEYTVTQKQNKTPVTEADLAINSYLIKELSKYNYPILSEEVEDDFETRQHADFFWIIDPLDGTKDFIQKTGEFSIMVGLANKKGDSILGIVYAPALGELYYGEKNKKAYLRSLCNVRPLVGEAFSNGAVSIIQNNNDDSHCEERLVTWQSLMDDSKKIQVSKDKSKNGKILTSRNHLGKYEQEIAQKYKMQQVPAGSAGLKICWIARGDAELYINSSDKSGLWDICAADIILQKAGGFICDKNFNQIKYNIEETGLLKGYIASNVQLGKL